MSITNSQYDEIMREYDSKQLSNQHKSEAIKIKAYGQDSRLKEIDDAIASYSVAAAKHLLYGDKQAANEIKAKIAEQQALRDEILDQLGLDENFFKPVYSCADCRDTGYINGQKCHCLKQAIINTVYTQSNLKSILKCENFDALSYDFYSDDTKIDNEGRSELDNMRDAVAECHRFIDEFEDKPKNILFMGQTGVGKTFLSNCIAKELLDQGKSVIYFSAQQLFDNLGKGYFEKDSDAIEANKNIFDCDLLIIDDLGTEFSNTFTISQLFLCINERYLRQKSTIISTNMSLQLLADTYSERVVSRFSSGYSMIKLSARDIRFQKRTLQRA